MMHYPIKHYNDAYASKFSMAPAPVKAYQRGGRLSAFNGYGFYGAEEEASELAALEADAQDLLADIEVAGEEIAEGISVAVAESRKHDEHRQMLYMVGAPLIVYVGLTNTKHKGMGLLSALAGLYIGVKNYQEHQLEAQADALESLSDDGSYGRPVRRQGCVPKKQSRKCPRHLPKVRWNGSRFVCCRR